MNRALADLADRLGGDRREPAFGVPHGGGGVAVHRAEVAAAIHERRPHHERLGHADQRFVDRAVAVRVVSAHDVADDRGALAVLDVGAQAVLPHRVDDPAMNRLHPIAHIRKSPAGDDRQGVVKVSRLGDLMEVGMVLAVRRHGSPRPAAGRTISASPRAV